jgi:hypothetical protein
MAGLAGLKTAPTQQDAHVRPLCFQLLQGAQIGLLSNCGCSSEPHSNLGLTAELSVGGCHPSGNETLIAGVLNVQ